jgi:hypothetical protein
MWVKSETCYLLDVCSRVSGAPSVDENDSFKTASFILAGLRFVVFDIPNDHVGGAVPGRLAFVLACVLKRNTTGVKNFAS